MTEDILEQIASDWLLQNEGVFVKLNSKYRPSLDHVDYSSINDNIHSDIDLLSVNLREPGVVTILNCKSWMDGFDCRYFLDHLQSEEQRNKKFGGKEIWKHFRELVEPKWTEGFIRRIRAEVPGVTSIRYIVACTFAKNEDAMLDWSEIEAVRRSFLANDFPVPTFSVIGIRGLVEGLQVTTKDFAARSHLARTIQLLKAGKVRIE